MRHVNGFADDSVKLLDGGKNARSFNCQYIGLIAARGVFCTLLAAAVGRIREHKGCADIIFCAFVNSESNKEFFLVDLLRIAAA